MAKNPVVFDISVRIGC